MLRKLLFTAATTAAMVAAPFAMQPAQADDVCVVSVLCASQSYCYGYVNYCPNADACWGLVNVCLGADACGGGVNVCNTKFDAQQQ